MLMKGDIRFDKRILERNLRDGIISEEEYKRHLKELKDLTNDSVPVESQLAPLGHPVPGRRLEEEEEI